MSASNDLDVYDKLNTAFKQTSKAILGGEIGELGSYENWLREYMHPTKSHKSYISDETIYSAHDFYDDNSRFIGFNEIDFNKRFEPLNINEVKDIDSIVEAINERFVYAGSIVLGNSKYVSRSSGIIDSFYVDSSTYVDESKYVAYSSQIRHSEYMFGTNVIAHSGFAIRTVGSGPGIKRAFESYFSGDASDIYYSIHISGGMETMFSFFVSGKRYVVGNNVLEKDKYFKIKSALLEQIRDNIQRKKFISYKDLLTPKDVNPVKDIKIEKCGADVELVKSHAKRDFGKASKVILGRELNLDIYHDYLTSICPYFNVSREVSPLSGEVVYCANSLVKHDGLSSVFLGMEWPYAFNLKISSNIVNSADLHKIINASKDIAFDSIYFYINSSNVFPPLCAINALDCYNVVIPINVKHSAYSTWPRDSDYAFGSSEAFRSKFVINTYFSSKITRGFEVDNSFSSSDVYFVHNVEDVAEGMFCFNTKSKRHALGNAEYPRSKYLKLKSDLLGQITEELEKNKKLKWNIYNIGRSG